MITIEEHEFKKKLSLLQATLIGVGSTMGAGLFVLLSPAFALAGPAVLVAFGINAVIAIIIAGNYAEAASFNPLEGGGFRFVEEVYGKKAQYLGWIVWLGNTAYASLSAIGIGQYVATVFPVSSVAVSVLVLLLFSLLNIVGSKNVALIEKPLTLSLLLALTVTAGYLLLNPSGSGSITPFFSNGVSKILPATSLLFVTFIGFEAITTISAEIKYAKKNIPKALFRTVAIVTSIYFLVVLALIFSTDPSVLSGNEIALLSAVKSSKMMYSVVIFAAILAMASTLNIALMAGARNVYSLANDGFVPKKLGTINERFESPIRAVVLTSIIALLLVVTNQIGFVASVSNLAYMLVVSSVGMAVIKLRKQESEGTYKIPFYPWSSIACVLLPLMLIPFLELKGLIMGIMWLIAGFVLDVFYISDQEKSGKFKSPHPFRRRKKKSKNPIKK